MEWIMLAAAVIVVGLILAFFLWCLMDGLESIRGSEEELREMREMLDEWSRDIGGRTHEQDQPTA